MGFGNVASALILLIAVMTLSTAVVLSLKDYYDKTTTSVSLVQAELTKELRTDITIDVVHLDNTSNTLSVYIKNSGSQKLDPAQLDVYLDKIYIPRNDSNRTVTILADTEMTNNTIWDPKEQVQIQIFNYSLATNTLHEITVTTQYGVKNSYEFTV